MMPKHVPAMAKTMESDLTVPPYYRSVNETARRAAKAGDATRHISRIADLKGPRRFVKGPRRSVRGPRRAPDKRRSGSEDIEKFADALRQADKQRMAHERVADRHFIEIRQPAEQHEVVEIEIVPRVDAESKRVGELRRA